MSEEHHQEQPSNSENEKSEGSEGAEGGAEKSPEPKKAEDFPFEIRDMVRIDKRMKVIRARCPQLKLILDHLSRELVGMDKALIDGIVDRNMHNDGLAATDIRAARSIVNRASDSIGETEGMETILVSVQKEIPLLLKYMDLIRQDFMVERDSNVKVVKEFSP